MFKEIKLWKSENIWATKNTFYIFCYRYQKDNYKEFNKSIDITDENSEFNTKYINSNNNFSLINKLIQDIYKIRINAWIKLIGIEDLKISRG